MSKQFQYEDIKTLNFDICPAALNAFKRNAKDINTEEEKEAFKDAIVAVDVYLGIEKDLKTKGVATPGEYEDMVDAVEDAKEEIAEAGLKGHNYHQTHLDAVKDLVKDPENLDEEFIAYLEEAIGMDRILKAVRNQVEQGVDIQDASWEVSRAKDVEASAHEIFNAYMEKYGINKATDKVRNAVRNRLRKKYGFRVQEEEKVCWDGYKQVGMKKKNGKEVPNCVPEEHGAGEEGSDEVVRKYKQDTPGETIEEETLNEQCDLIGMRQIREFEKFVDRLFAKFGIDFKFTKHFADRMSDSRNKPCITLQELADFIKKMYARQGKSIKTVAGAEAVVKDLQTDLNIPVAVEYDARNDEFDVVMKTIMRKKNFRTPNKVIKY